MNESPENTSDWEYSEDELEDYNGQDMHEVRVVTSTTQQHARKQISRTDASSIVGGISVDEVYPVNLKDVSDEFGAADHDKKGEVAPHSDSATEHPIDSKTTSIVPISDNEELQELSEEISTEKSDPISEPNLSSEAFIASARSSSTSSSSDTSEFESGSGSGSRSGSVSAPASVPTGIPKPSTAATPSPSSNQKVFSFSLPFGLSNIRSNIYKQIKEFKSDIHIPLINNNPSDEEPLDEEIVEHVRLRLERQESLNTLLEAKYFKKIKSHDDARLRAIKKNITNSVNGIRHPTRKKENPHESIFNELEGNIIILGGYRGSILKDVKTDKRLWIPIKAGFNLGKINLLLGPKIDDEINASKYIYPDGMIKNIGPLDISKKLIKKLAANSKINIKDFGYDWRLSGEVVSSQLEQFMDDMYVSTSGKPIIVIAHSMGGMITHSVMQRRPELFRSIVYVGCPSECLNILGPIRFGDAVIFSDKILTPETNFMMRSGFNFLPLSGRVFVNKHTQEFYDLDYFNPDTWVEYNLNPLVAKKRKDREEERKKLLALAKNSSLGGSAQIARKASIDASIAEESESTPDAEAPAPPDSAKSASSLSSTLVTPTPNKTGAKTVPMGTAKSESSFLSLPDISSIGNKLRSCSPISMVRKNKPSKLEQLSKSLSPSKASSTSSTNDHLDVGTLVGSNADSVSPVETIFQDEEEEASYSISFTDAYEYLKDSLFRAKRFILSLDYNAELEDLYPPLVVVYGNRVPSVRGSEVSSIDDIKEGNYYNFYYGHGDGVIHQKWLMPQKKGFDFFDAKTGAGQIVGKFASDCGHVSLMTDIEAMGKALGAIVEAEAIWPEKKRRAREVKKLR